MRLLTYLNGLSADERKSFARKAKTSVPYLTHLAKGRRQASPRLAKRLSDAAAGQVALSDLRPDIWPKAA